VNLLGAAQAGPFMIAATHSVQHWFERHGHVGIGIALCLCGGGVYRMQPAEAAGEAR
jgi:hypothetical protein